MSAGGGAPAPEASDLEARLAAAGRALVLGIGGGGDVVGSLAVVRRLEARGVEAVLGGVAWERFAVDPYPGPRPPAEIRGGRWLGKHAVLAAPDDPVTTPEGVHFCESRMASFLGEPTVLIDAAGGASGAADGIAAAAEELSCDLVVLVDIGGDAIAAGPEPGLASPLCDALLIAAGAELMAKLPVLLVILGAGCDGELRPADVLDRVATLARAGAWLGAMGTPAETAMEIEAAAEQAVTEASRLVALCARGTVGTIEIRGGLRTVEASPIAAIAFWFDLAAALPELPLARAVAGTGSVAAGRDALATIGVRTELDYERERAAEA